ncbi:MAG TPA: lipoate--protein ligase family protein [Planctomycetes bacterium]|nr:lipoate--protein ligase family protein [Planctomycetota bacterium]
MAPREKRSTDGGSRFAWRGRPKRPWRRHTMLLLDLTLPTPAENLALDEALLEEAEAAGRPLETLRLWEPSHLFVVVGRSSQRAQEVRLEACREAGVAVLRRASGGAAVVVGPGCLMYTAVLSYQLRPALRAVDHAHRFVLERIARSLRRLVPSVRRCGISDLALDDRKFSGNSMRTKRTHFLYHGTLLYDFPLRWADRLLNTPPRQPTYRRRRSHGQFLINLPLSLTPLRAALIEAWPISGPRRDWPRQDTLRLVAERYGRREWHEVR